MKEKRKFWLMVSEVIWRNIIFYWAAYASGNELTRQGIVEQWWMAPLGLITMILCFIPLYNYIYRKEESKL